MLLPLLLQHCCCAAATLLLLRCRWLQAAFAAGYCYHVAVVGGSMGL